MAHVRLYDSLIGGNMLTLSTIPSAWLMRRQVEHYRDLRSIAYACLLATLRQILLEPERSDSSSSRLYAHSHHLCPDQRLSHCLILMVHLHGSATFMIHSDRKVDIRTASHPTVLVSKAPKPTPKSCPFLALLASSKNQLQHARIK